MNNIEEIISYMCDNSAASGVNVFGLFSKAFDESNEIELLKKRALFIEHCERVIKELDYEDDTFEDIFKVLSHRNLAESVSIVAPKLTKTHKTLALSTFRHYKTIKKEHEVDDIIDLSNDLKTDLETEDLTPSQKEILYEICETVEQAKDEHKLIGNAAVKKLFDILVGKLFLHKDEISNIKSTKIKEKLGKVYKKVQEVNSLMGFLLSVKDNGLGLLNFFN